MNHKTLAVAPTLPSLPSLQRLSLHDRNPSNEGGDGVSRDIGADSLIVLRQYAPFVHLSYHTCMQRAILKLRKRAVCPENAPDRSTRMRVGSNEAEGVEGEVEGDAMSTSAASAAPLVVEGASNPFLDMSFTPLSKDRLKATDVKHSIFNAVRVVEFRDAGNYSGWTMMHYSASSRAYTFRRLERITAAWEELSLSCLPPSTTVAYSTNSWPSDNVDALNEAHAALSRRLRPSEAVEMAPTGDRAVSEIPLRLEEEYRTHCFWLKLVQQPSQPEPINTAFSTLRGRVSGLPQVELDACLTAWNRVRETLSQQSSSVSQLPWDLIDATEADEDIADLIKNLIRDSVESTNAMDESTLGQPKFAPTSSNTYGAETSAKRMDAFRQFMVTIAREHGSLYSRAKKANEYELEHITPKSWMHMIPLIDELRYGADDTLMLGMVVKSDNRSRGNKSLGFSRRATDATWSIPRGTASTHAFLARAVAYASLTYPLLNGDGVTPNLQTESHPPPSGTPSYREQARELLRLIQSPPSEWELQHSMACYALFEVVNPLTVSRAARDAVADPTHPFHRMLMARWSGTDPTSTELLRTLHAMQHP